MARLIIAIAAFTGIVSAVYFFVPIGRAEKDELSFRKYRIAADFPCRPKRTKDVIGSTETGEEISQTTLVCTQGGVVYSLSATEYPEEALKTVSAEAWANRTLDGVRSQPNWTLKSSSQLSYQSFPAIRMHTLDSKAPPVERTRLSVLTDAGTILIGVSWPSGSPEPSSSTTFASSLTVTSVKK